MLELLTGVIVTIAVLALVIEPLVTRRPITPTPLSVSELFVDPEESESPRIRALVALKEIEFDRATGKISDDDYATLRRQYGRAALEAMDEDDGDADPGGSDVDAAIAAARANLNTSCPDCGERPETAATFCSSCGRSLKSIDARPRCWMCGVDLPEDAKFCAGCGDTVAV